MIPSNHQSKSLLTIQTNPPLFPTREPIPSCQQLWSPHRSQWQPQQPTSSTFQYRSTLPTPAYILVHTCVFIINIPLTTIPSTSSTPYAPHTIPSTTASSQTIQQHQHLMYPSPKLIHPQRMTPKIPHTPPGTFQKHMWCLSGTCTGPASMSMLLIMIFYFFSIPTIVQTPRYP